MPDTILLNELNKMLDTYQNRLKDQIKYHPLDRSIAGKLEAVNDIRHRILVLSKGGIRIVDNN